MLFRNAAPEISPNHSQALAPTQAQDPRHAFGYGAEARAEGWFLEQFPAHVISRNYRKRFGEIDLIFEQRIESGACELVFVEVRARSEGGWVTGVESVNHRKRQRLSRTVRQFLAVYRGPATSVRFDILAWNGRQWTHVRNVWIEDR